MVFAINFFLKAREFKEFKIPLAKRLICFNIVGAFCQLFFEVSEEQVDEY